MYPEEMVRPMRDELTRIGFRELRSPAEVDAVLGRSKGTVLMVVNSICGCAAGKARPAVAMALEHPVRPEVLTTVFAGQDDNPSGRMVQAAFSGDIEKVRRDLDQGAPIDAVDKEGKTALNRAALMGRADVVALLLERGANVDGRSRFGKTALMAAASKGHISVVNRLFESHADVNARDDYNQTALICASVRGRGQIVNVLLQKGADVNVKTKKGFSALSLASDQGHENIVEAILQRKPVLNICDSQKRLSTYR